MTYFKWNPGSTAYQMNQACGPKQNGSRFSASFQNLPLVNVLESETEWTLELAVPGLKKSDIQIGIENNLLKVSAKLEESADNKPNFLRKEFSFNEFEKSFKLPKNADLKQVQATCADGVLEIKIAKMVDEKPASTQIPVL